MSLAVSLSSRMAVRLAMTSILSSTKELLGIPAEVTDFDSRLKIYINSAIGVLNQIVNGPATPYQLDSYGGDIEHLIPNDSAMQNIAQMYIYSKVRLEFDPPSSSAVLTSLQNKIAEYEWRLSDYTVKTSN